MRNVTLKISAVVLVACYLMSIIGFGVHTCMKSERTFVTAFVSSSACQDIHPEHHCADSHHCCGHDEDALSFRPSACCSDDFVVLTVTGTIPSGENDHYGCPSGDFFNATGLLSEIHPLSVKSDHYMTIFPSDSGCIVSGDMQSVLGIWRI